MHSLSAWDVLFSIINREYSRRRRIEHTSEHDDLGEDTLCSHSGTSIGPSRQRANRAVSLNP